jgi:hypothetical protein
MFADPKTVVGRRGDRDISAAVQIKIGGPQRVCPADFTSPDD